MAAAPPRPGRDAAETARPFGLAARFRSLNRMIDQWNAHPVFELTPGYQSALTYGLAPQYGADVRPILPFAQQSRLCLQRNRLIL